MRRNWIWPVLVVVVLAAATLVMVIVRGGYRNLGTTLTTQVVTTATTDKNAFVEAGGTVDPVQVTGAKFASVTLTGADEAKTYLVAARQPAFVALATAVAAAAPVEGSVPSGGATLVFAFEDRHTVTFDLDIGAGLIGRGGKAWRPKGDLAALIGAVTTAKE